MDAVAIRKRPQTVPNGRMEELHPNANPYMTQTERAA